MDCRVSALPTASRWCFRSPLRLRGPACACDSGLGCRHSGSARGASLACLEARWRGAAVQTCKMFALLSSELALETTYLVSTVAQSVEEAQALGERVPAAPSVGVIFSNTRGPGGAQKGSTQGEIRGKKTIKERENRVKRQKKPQNMGADRGNRD